MALPASVRTVTVTDDFTRADGSTPSGSVQFIPSVRSAVLATPGGTITIDPVKVQLSAGVFSIALADNNDADLNPHGWTYLVVMTIGGVRYPSFSISLPALPATTVALRTLAPVDAVVPTEVRVRTVEGIAPDASGNIDLPASGGSAPNTRLISTTGGIVGGGDLSADRTLSLTYGVLPNTVMQGNDPRGSDARTPTAHAHVLGDVTGLSAALAAKASLPVCREAYLVAGNINLNVGSPGAGWEVLPGTPSLIIPAAVGDKVVLSATLGRQANSNLLMDIGVVVGGVIKRWMGTPANPPAVSYEGDIGLYHTNVPVQTGPRRFTVVAGDLDTTNVVFMILRKVLGAGSALALMSGDNPGYWQATNMGVVA